MKKEYSEPPEIILKEGFRWIPLEVLYNDEKDVPIGLLIAYRVDTGGWFNQNIGVTTGPDPEGRAMVWGDWLSTHISLVRNTPLERYISNGILVQDSEKGWMNLEDLWTIYKSPDYEDKTLEDAFV